MSRLGGLRILNTRPLHQARELDALLRSIGAEPLSYPCIAIEPPDDLAPLTDALTRLAGGAFDWLVLTSQNTVRAIADAPGQFAATPTTRIAAVGRATAEAIQRDLGLRVDLVPELATAQALAESLPLTTGARVLLPQSAIAPPTLADRLTARGARVETVVAYQTVTGFGGVDLAREVATGGIDAVVFASASAVWGYVARATPAGIDPGVARAIPAVCIGPSTAEAARQAEFQSVLVASEQSTGGLAAALTDALAHHSREVPA